jgi:thiol:disulfide interchange protein
MKGVPPYFMKMFCRSALCLVAVFLFVTVIESRAAGPEVPKTSSAVYDEGADGEKQIAEALAAAKPEGKRVLLQFGANWCGWCVKLHKLFHDDAAIAAELKAHYVVVAVDVNRGHNKAVDTRLGNPSYLGLPALVVLDAEGKQLKTQDSSELEQGSGHSQAKVLAFLKTWAPGGGK